MPFCDDAKVNIVTNQCPDGNLEGFNVMPFSFLSENSRGDAEAPKLLPLQGEGWDGDGVM
jgi:hypothetical protein